MNRTSALATASLFLLPCVLLAFADPALAAGRRFQPVVQSTAQRTDLINNMMIVSSSGRRINAGAALSPESAKRSWIMISVKNKGSTPVSFDEGSLAVFNEGKALSLYLPEETGGKLGKPVLQIHRHCVNGDETSYSNCISDAAANYQGSGSAVEEAKSAVKSALPRSIAPNEVFPTQFLVDLPKKSKARPATLTLVVSVDGEQLSFDFKEVD